MDPCTELLRFAHTVSRPAAARIRHRRHTHDQQQRSEKVGKRCRLSGRDLKWTRSAKRQTRKAPSTNGDVRNQQKRSPQTAGRSTELTQATPWLCRRSPPSNFSLQTSAPSRGEARALHRKHTGGRDSLKDLTARLEWRGYCAYHSVAHEAPTTHNTGINTHVKITRALNCCTWPILSDARQCFCTPSPRTSTVCGAPALSSGDAIASSPATWWCV